VAAVVAMLALGRGAQSAIEAQLASLGSNLLVLRAGALRIGGVAQDAGATTRLTMDDALAIQEKVGDINAVSPNVNGRAQVTYLNKNWSTSVQGAGWHYAKMHASEPALGRFFTDDEDKKRSRVAVIGHTLVRELFNGKSPIGEMLKINKVNFQVIGVLPEKGATGFRDQDDIVVVPLQTAMRRLLGKDYVDNIDIEAKDADHIYDVEEGVLNVMLSRHRVPPSQKDEAFQIRNMADIQAALAQSTQTMTALLASIAAISLLVGGIGIMNIMLASVTERTKEIGLRKAIGAKRRDILLQFLAESVVVSAVGGMIGILIGWLITVVLSSVAGWTTEVAPDSILLAFFFSAFIGMIFGIYPARKASALHPIDALRYE
jgi:macrolide transport system ATP-binding/permease protein